MLYIGLMSGTSMDGVDAVLAQLSADHPAEILAHASIDMPSTLRQEFMALQQPGADELARAALAGNALADLYAQAVKQVLETANITACAVSAVGAHGQTVRHHPEQGYTIQIHAPARLAELCRIRVITDFRSRDIAAGGQGAPLAPVAHQALFARTARPCVILNLGGIANITLLDAHRPLTGFDTGPANVLMDHWSMRHHRTPYDCGGAWAATGTVHQPLLQHLLASEPWFSLPPPKSTGRHLFNEPWLDQRLAAIEATSGPIRAADVQATLMALTARSIGEAIQRHAPDTREVVVCGGGARNTALLQALQAQLPSGCQLMTSLAYGVDPQLVEALAFAWLAWAWEHQVPAGQPDVTGAQGPRVLGCCYPA